MSQVFEVLCHKCSGIFDLPSDPGKTWLCECQKSPPSPFKRYWIACQINPRHRYYANRAEDCKFCTEEKENKKALITLEHKGLRIDGETIKPTFERHDQSLLTSIGIERDAKIIQNIKQDKQDQKDRFDQIIQLLKSINDKLTPPQEPKELDDK
jgi:hypothetical protein